MITGKTELWPTRIPTTIPDRRKHRKTTITPTVIPTAIRIHPMAHTPTITRMVTPMGSGTTITLSI
ncbi:MAG TPA: hypothetical protein VHE54_00040 [Puia sp.]|nr:hypothetical protein [Puia sp.]